MTTPAPAFPAAVEPTADERITALETTVARLAVERDDAVKARDRANARADVHTAVANTALARLEEACTELRRANARCRELAADNEALTRQNERLRSEPQRDDHTTRWPWRRVGNQL